MMEEKHEELYEKALDAIRELLSDCSVSVETTIDSLHGLKDEIEIMLDALQSTRSN